MPAPFNIRRNFIDICRRMSWNCYILQQPLLLFHNNFPEILLSFL